MTKEDYFSDLNEEERDIIVNKGTETPFSGKYNNHYDGVFFVEYVKTHYMNQIVNLTLDVDGLHSMTKFWLNF